MNKKIFGMALSTLAMAVCPTLGNALVVTIEPDDYYEGADLSNVSPYVTMQRLSSSFPGEPNPPSPVFAGAKQSPLNPGLSPTPTGQLSFGSAAYNGFYDEPYSLDTVISGIGLFFNQDVTDLSILAVRDFNTPQVGVAWHGFNEAGMRISSGYTHMDMAGVVTKINMLLEPGIRSVVFGTQNGYGSIINYDHLNFTIADSSAHVPEPSALGLLGLGLAFLGLRSRRKA